MHLMQYDVAQGVIDWHIDHSLVQGKSTSLQVLYGATPADYQIYLGGVL